MAHRAPRSVIVGYRRVAHPLRFLQRVGIPNCEQLAILIWIFRHPDKSAFETFLFFPQPSTEINQSLVTKRPLLSTAERSTMELCAQFSRAPDEFPLRSPSRKSAPLSPYSGIFYAQPSANQYFASARHIPSPQLQWNQYLAGIDIKKM